MSSPNPHPLFAAVVVPHFTAQAMIAAQPALRGMAFAVADQAVESHKTPVLDVSPAAETRGVHPGLPVFLMRRKWPRMPVLPRDAAAETLLRDRMRALWTRCTPEFTVRDNGGAMLDMTGTPLGREALPRRGVTSPEQGMLRLAGRLQAGLLGLGLESAAIGIGSSQVMARVLARLGAPDGLLVCIPGGESRALDRLSPLLLPGLSPGARERLRKYGFATVGAVRSLEKEALILRFGAEGEKLYSLARGLDLEPVLVRRKPLAVETVLSHDVNDEAALRNQVRLTADKLGHALRGADGGNGRKANRFTMILMYSDGRAARRTLRLHPPTAAFQPLAEGAVALFLELYKRRVALRRIRLLVTAPAVETGQRELFETEGEGKREALEAAIDRIRAKRSFGAVLSGSNVERRAKSQRFTVNSQGSIPGRKL
jgi:DNA polymerase-4